VVSQRKVKMDIRSLVTELREEIRRIENAINALIGLGSVSAPHHRGRLPKSQAAQLVPRKRKMSAAARKRIAAAQRARWAKQKAESTPKKAPSAKKVPVRKGMSPAARKKLSAMMKARWAARKNRA